MIYATIKTDQAKVEEIREFYNLPLINNPKNPYLIFQGEKDGIDISCYKNRKEIYTITFSGDEEKVRDAALFFTDHVTFKQVAVREPKEPYSLGWEDLSYQIGSDETGKGEFFGPLVVCAAYVTPEDIDFLKRYKIDDSKKMSDNYIFQIGPIIKKRIKNFVVLITPKKLSESYDKKSMNTDKMLSLCHNTAQAGLIRKYAIPEHVICYIDQFLPRERYQNYVKDLLIPNPLYFRTKAESHFPSVACASVIARYTLLKEWEKMNAHFNTVIPIGSGSNVDEVFARLKKQNTDVDNYVKKYFRNYEN